MALRTDTIGRTYPSDTYAVGREKIREYARAVGETTPVHLALDAARAAGHADLVAPPMFAVVYSVPSVTHPLVDPDVEVDFARLVHGGRRRCLKIAAAWPWADAITAAWQRIQAIPQAP